jgi:tetratricopeptide (TPR) repeat protein
MRLRSILGLVASILILSSTSFAGNDADQWWHEKYQIGMNYLEAADYSKAENEFEDLLRKDRKLGHAHYGLGLAYMRRKPSRINDARLHLRSATKLEPKFRDAWYALIELEDQRWPEKLPEVYAGAILALPEDDEIYKGLFQFANIGITGTGPVNFAGKGNSGSLFKYRT